MMVVSVEIWPDGDIRRRHVIGSINIANISDLAAISDYECSVDGGPKFIVKNHRRSDGWATLLAKVLRRA